MAKTFDPKKAETPGFKPGQTTTGNGVKPLASGKMGLTKSSKASNSAVRGRVRASGPVGSKVGAGVKPSTRPVIKAKLTTPLTKRNTAAVNKPVMDKPIYTTPGFKPGRTKK